MRRCHGLIAFRFARLLSKAAGDIAVTPGISEEKANKTAATKTIRFIVSI
jgi:hypothetical protein